MLPIATEFTRHDESSQSAIMRHHELALVVALEGPRSQNGAAFYSSISRLGGKPAQMTDAQNKRMQAGHRQPWGKPELKLSGEVGEIIKQGGGKISVRAADPGEGTKSIFME
jgi:hypothetical protein